jgi:hypothetical protein
MTLLAVKVLLAPGFVVMTSLAGRRFGIWVGGMLGGLPVVGAPILLIYALAHGDRFAAHASDATLLGLISLMSFVALYARLAGRWPWWPTLLAGWAVFALLTFLFTFVKLTAASGWLGPQVSGLLAPFPVLASVLAAFTHAQRGHPEVVRLSGGLVLGYAAYALFCFTLALTLDSLGTLWAFTLACAVALCWQAAMLAGRRALAKEAELAAPA